ncbi:MAG: bifunctional metallophosphatase/5'-nucleotidase [Elusimicrobia bacterium]|nr:bifunctional metallophosphatase/5'-nucleotidase [Elusimicrobiota bacterium]
MNYLKRLAAACGFLLVSAGLYFVYWSYNFHPVTFVFTSDGHGHILPERSWDEKDTPPLGGLGALSTFLTGLKEDYILTDSGDIFQGTPEGMLTEGRVVVELMNELGYRAAALGNHEFDYGQETLKNLEALASFPFLGSNIRLLDSEEQPDWVSPPFIIEEGDLSIGLIGAITQDMPKLTGRDNIEGLEFTDIISEVRTAAADLRKQGADIILLLSHAGYEDDLHIAEELSQELDIILGGHTHLVLDKPKIKKGVILGHPGCNFQYAGRLRAYYSHKRNRINAYKYRLYPLRTDLYPPDEEIEALINSSMGEAAEMLNEEIGQVTVDLPSSLYGNGRGHRELALGNWQTDIMRESLGVDFAFQNTGGIRTPLLKGPLKVRDIWKLSPFGNHLVEMTLTGQQVRRLLEESVSGGYSYLQVSGLNFVFNTALPEGMRVLNVIVVDDDGGKTEIDDEEEYRLVTNSFLAGGGDGYTVFTEGKDVVETEIIMRDLQISYIRENPEVYASVEGRKLNVNAH